MLLIPQQFKLDKCLSKHTTAFAVRWRDVTCIRELKILFAIVIVQILADKSCEKFRCSASDTELFTILFRNRNITNVIRT